MQIHVTHLSTACILLEIGSFRILTDPVFDIGRQRYRLGPAAYATRFIGPALAPVSLPPLDLVLLTHAHHLDNLDVLGEQFVKTAPRVLTGTRDTERAGDGAQRLNVWDSTTITTQEGIEIKITATPALHGPRWLPESWHVIGFVLEWKGQENGGIYISGDTVWFGGIRKIANRFRIGTAILHLGAVNFWPPWPSFLLRCTFNGREAARCARRLEAKTVIPVHYERSVWTHFKESTESYNNEFADAGVGSRVRWLRQGERSELVV
ncbi:MULTISPECIES: MBL fold metallo-hydrolase [Rhodopirellula]|uniref:MBL fold metallo-hydrolase n=1 Tax=Rhodopirellula sp. MGV TaxID=2023130 RepID=UPI0013044028